MKEEWKDVVGYEGIYKVSNMGRVKSIPRKFRRVCDSVDSFAKGKNLKCGLATTGYPSVDLRKDGTKKLYMFTVLLHKRL